MQTATKKYRVTVIVRVLETYEVKAESADEAEENWHDGAVIATDDEAVDNEILSVEEVQP